MNAGIQVWEGDGAGHSDHIIAEMQQQYDALMKKHQVLEGSYKALESRYQYDYQTNRADLTRKNEQIQLLTDKNKEHHEHIAALKAQIIRLGERPIVG